MPEQKVVSAFLGYSTAKPNRFMPPEYITGGKNFVVKNGVVKARNVFQLVYNNSSDVIDLGLYLKQSSTGTFDGFYHKSSSGGTSYYVSLSSSLTRTSIGTAANQKPMFGVFFGDRFLIADTDNLQVIEGTTIRDSGLPALSLGSWGALSTTGVAGTWASTASQSYVVTQVIKTSNYEVESTISSRRTQALALTTDGIVIPRPTMNANATHWRIYRRLASSDGLFFRVTEQTAATASYTDNGDTTSSQLPGPTDNTQLTDTIIDNVMYNKRLWALSSSKKILYFSKLDSPEYFPTNYKWDFDQQNGVAKRLIALEDVLLIFFSNAVYGIFGDNTTNFRIVKLLNYGIENVDCITKGISNNTVYFQNSQGIFEWAIGAEPVNIGNLIWYDFYQRSELNFKMMVDRWNGWVWIIDPTADGTLFIYDPRIKQFIGKFKAANAVYSMSTGGNGFAVCISDSAATDLYYYTNVSGVGTSEGNFDFDLIFGSMVDERLQQKLFRQVVFGIYSTNSSSGSTMTVKHQTENDASPVTDYTFAGEKDVYPLIPFKTIQHALDLNLELTVTGIQNVTMELGMLRIEYDLVGAY